METLLNLTMYILVPLVWGLGVECAFARLRRWRRRRAAAREGTR